MRAFLLLAILPLLSAAGIGLFDTHADVGETPKAGNAARDADAREYRVTGGGANIWGTVDAFHFVSKKISGDFILTADVRFIGEGAVAHRKAALMVRASLDPGAAYADIAVHGDGLTSLQYRLENEGNTAEIRSTVAKPVRIRLQRRGSQITAYTGEDMQTVGSIAVALEDPVYLGLAVCSHDANILETAVFSNVTLE
jgi:hypothetical protein